MELTSQEGRVLGALVEKQLATPQLYPLTENALMAACNQSSSRDPVVAYDVSTVRRATISLREKGLLRTVHRTGERSDKHRHLLDTALALSTAQVSLLAILLLRGPQTLAELRARSERMYPFDTLEQVQQTLDTLSSRDDPLVVRLERQPGRKEARYAQNLVEPETGLVGPIASDSVPSDSVPSDSVPSDSVPSDSVPAGSLSLVGLAREVELLRAEVAQLRMRVEGPRE